MVYAGAKTRIWGQLKQHVLEYIEDADFYFEPFGGGMNCVCSVPDTIPRFVSDIDRFNMALWQGLQNGIEIPEKLCSREEYELARDISRMIVAPNWKGEYLDASELGEENIVRIACWRFLGSFSGHPFNGWVGSYKKRDYYGERRRGLMKQVEDAIAFNDIAFLPPNDYRKSMDMVREIVPDGARGIIYCDPPYAHTKTYQGCEINHEEFWDWVREQKAAGHYVYVSEYTAPPDFNAVWEYDLLVGMRNKKLVCREYATEKLFI